MDNAGDLKEPQPEPEVAPVSRVVYHNYLWKYCGYLLIVPFVKVITHRAWNSIKGAAVPSWTRTLSLHPHHK